VVVPAAFGDIAGDFILDASAATSSLHVSVAQSAGILEERTRATLRLAGRRIERFDMAIADLGSLQAGRMASIAGVIGADALGAWTVEIDTAPCRVRLERRPRGRWARRLPLRRIAGVPAVRAAISDGVTSRAGWFAIDTGSLGTLVADARLTRTPPPDAPDPPARLRALSLAGALYEQTPAGLAPDAAPGLAGSIGQAVWSHYRMRLDIARGWLELAPSSAGRF
jgi:hypothetical protein